MVLCGVSVYGVWVSDGAQRDGARARGQRVSSARSASDERARERGALRSSGEAAEAASAGHGLVAGIDAARD